MCSPTLAAEVLGILAITLIKDFWPAFKTSFRAKPILQEKKNILTQRCNCRKVWRRMGSLEADAGLLNAVLCVV